MEIEKNEQENQSNQSSSRPDFIDNIDDNTMSAALRSILGFGSSDAESLSSTGLASTSPSEQLAHSALSSAESGIDELRIASAYCSLSGLFNAAPVVKKLPKVRLLLGAEPIGDALFWQRRLAESEADCLNRRLGKSLEQQQDGLKTECDNLPFDSEFIDKIHRLADALRAGRVETRLFKENFLHAKAYIFSRAGEAGENGGIIAGSSNLTASGLRKNYELNLGRYDAATLTKALAWFDGLWDRAEPFDLIALLDGVLQLHTPYEIFMRVLWELYGDEFEVSEPDPEEFDEISTFATTTFQKHGVARAMSLLKEYGGAIVADEVGLGKTFIAAAVMKIYQRRGQRALLICPAALRDTVWKQFSSDYSHFIEAISYEELGVDEQIFGDNPSRKSKAHIMQRIQSYRLVIIDEAHNYRNDGVATRSEALKGLLSLQSMHVLMLTATPVNNSLMDLHQLIKYYIRQDDALHHRGIRSIEKRFNDAIKVDPHDLSPDVLFPIIDATTIKRTRR
ncbi:MAG: DEAD/DEAH box helicase family protein, partial [Proteobacteria bacterium]|nr:DEAD/DEAH box helicase family protein [Pseudomonadota bacterium]